MEIRTKDFGPVTIDPEKIIRFPGGLFAFEEEREFILLKSGDFPAVFLQSISGEDPRFILFKAEDVCKQYRPKLSGDILHALSADAPEELDFYVIAVIPDDIRKTTVNLKSPVIVNLKKRLAVQAVLEEGGYGVHHRILADGEEGGSC